VKATTEQIVSALRVLSVEMHSEDGVANAVVAEAADRLTLMANLVARHVEETKEDVEQMAVASETMVEATAKIQSLRARIKRLEEAGDAILNANNDDEEYEAIKQWRKAKEAKP
jgi:cysteinyl-tRNA synthetase